MQIEDILNFKCPRWEEIPDRSFLSSQLIDYMNRILDPLILEKPVLTKSMIQNYFKWDILPGIEGRKYSREQIAFLLVITVYKQILPIYDIKRAVFLQLRKTGGKEAYDRFAEILERSLQDTFSGLIEGDTVVLPERRSERHYSGLDTLTYAFALRLLSLTIMNASGIEKIEV